MLKSVKVRDYMTTDLVTFTPGMDLFRAIDKLLMHRISGAPVLDENGYLIGLLSEGDCLKGILAGSYFEEAGGSVASVMTTVVETIDADADIVKAAVSSTGECNILHLSQNWAFTHGNDEGARVLSFTKARALA